MNQTGAIINGDGTSASAPIVSGIAGLLLSFDSRLKASDLKSLIVDGANAGGWKATRTAGGEQYNIVNAYESLKLAARRRGAPLCGNRLWATPDSLMAERSDGDETLYAQAGSSFGVQLQSVPRWPFRELFRLPGIAPVDRWSVGPSRQLSARLDGVRLDLESAWFVPRWRHSGGDSSGVLQSQPGHGGHSANTERPPTRAAHDFPRVPGTWRILLSYGKGGCRSSPAGFPRRRGKSGNRCVRSRGARWTVAHAVLVARRRSILRVCGCIGGWQGARRGRFGAEFLRIDFRSMADGSLLRPSITFPYTNGTCTAFGVMAP